MRGRLYGGTALVAFRLVATTAAAELRRALGAADLAAVGALTDERFTWTGPDGRSATRQELVEDLAAGRLEFGTAGSDSAAFAMHGEAAVVSGRWGVRRRAPAGAGPGGGAAADAA